MPTNLLKTSRIIACFILIFSTRAGRCQSTDLKVVSEWQEYAGQVRNDSNQRMVELKSLVPELRYDLRYATENNFMGRLMYPRNTRHSYLRKPVAEALARVQADLAEKGYGLKIFDAYRPYAVSVAFWELVGDERFVANPAKGSGHNRGIAVDLTIIEKSTGNELDMGTGFDNFSDTAHHDFTALSQQVLDNRKLLRETMEKYGFARYPAEWWHYSFPSAGRFDVLDISFKKLRKKKRL
jgi:D-alanyl-D-alanine dipeptidase